MGSVYYKADVEYVPGKDFRGGGEQALSAEQSSGAVRALSVLTGAKQWEFPLHSPPWAGLMATGGGLVFGGTNEGSFFALDARTGKPRWEFQTGAAIRANPVSFMADGRQRIAIASGNALFVFGL
jgi:alcohol dehydrogenase (cytochrome c)